MSCQGDRGAAGAAGAAAGCGGAGDGDVLVDARDVRFGYDAGREVLAGATLQVRRGGCVCLMGVNGCGKSTLLDCVLGEHAPASGQVEVAGRPVGELSAKQLARLVAYVPQFHENTFPYDVGHLVMMGRTPYLGLGGAPAADDEDRVRAALERCGIAHLAERPSTALSGGEMQMVLLARALVQEAPLVVMDEPTAHLDFRNGLVFMEAVERLVLQQGATVLMATHSPNQAFLLEAAGVRVQVAVMDGGRVAACGSLADVLTEKTLRTVFGVEAQVWERQGMRQVVPLATAARGGAVAGGDGKGALDGGE